MQQATVSMYENPTDEEIVHYDKLGLLPEGYTLALNTTLGTLSLITKGIPEPRMIAEQQFTMSELYLLLPLLNAHPHYCPYEVMLASFDYHKVTEKAIERCRKQLEEAMEEKVWDAHMRPVRNVLSRTRLKLRVFDITITSILETGYTLMPLSKQRYRHE